MRIDSLSVQHYKSLTNVALNEVGQLTVLVGKNAVGKSNTIDVLKFLRDMVKDGLEHAISHRGGINTLRQKSKTKPFKIKIEISFIDDELPKEASQSTYEIVIKSAAEGNYEIESEKISWSESIEKEVFNSICIKRDAFGTLLSNKVHAKSLVSDIKLPKDVSILRASFFRFENQFIRISPKLIRFISGFNFSSTYPNTLKAPSKPDTNHALSESGENWASVLKSLKRNNRGKAAFQQILEMMQYVLPELKDVVVKSVGSYLVPEFEIMGSHGIQKFDPAQLSDGTLRIFCILLALYQHPAPPLLMIEEPEQTIHPAVLSMLAEAFKEASERTQIIITTHSPYLVDCFSPEIIRVVTLDQDGTKIRPIKKTQVESVKESLISLENLMVAEGLMPEAV